DPIFNLAIKPVTAAEQDSWYGSKPFYSDPLQYSFGPTSGIYEPIWNSYRAVAQKTRGYKGQFDLKTKYQLQSLIPWNNLFYLKPLLSGGKDEKQTPYYGRQ